MPATEHATVIIPAHNEAGSIGPVIGAAASSRAIDRVIVVDDGSTDDTAAVARKLGAEVVRLDPNRGKGQAMRAGLDHAKNAQVIVFLDADLRGLRSEHIALLVIPIMTNDADHVVGLNARGPSPETMNALPLISGQRAVRRHVLDALPEEAWNGYGIETWITDAGARSPHGTLTIPLAGVLDDYKWQKSERGAAKMADMAATVVHAHRDVVKYRRPPDPATMQAECNSTKCVTDALADSMVKASAPAFHRIIAGPIWICTGLLAYVVAGPLGLAGTCLAWYATRPMGTPPFGGAST